MFSQKSKILKALSTTKGSSPENSPFITWHFELENDDIFSNILHSPSQYLCYLLNKEHSHEYLGIGATSLYEDYFDFKTIEKLSILHSDLHFLGGGRFYSKKNLQNISGPSPYSFLKEMYFFLPTLLLKRTPHGISLIISVQKKAFQDPKSPWLFQIDKLLTPVKAPSSWSPQKEKVKEVPSQDQWKEKISQIKRYFKSDEVQKIVLARTKEVSLKKDVDARALLRRLKHNALEGSFLYFMKTPYGEFISLSPEELFSVSERILKADCLAGTRPRSEIKTKDQEFAQELKQNPKELLEHRLVKQELKEYFSHFCETYDFAKQEEIKKYQYVQHLYTPFKGKLKKNKELWELVTKFHPTPAVGGRPKHKALHWLKAHEGVDRGFYAAPAGVISAQYTTFLVAIRSAFISPKLITLYGGCGIVEDSQWDSEWAETDVKMKGLMSWL